jgi:hypothetical protein
LLFLIAGEKENASISKFHKGEDKANLVVFTDFPNEVTESLVHIDALLSRRLDESAPQVLRKITTLCDHNGQQTLSVVIAGNEAWGGSVPFIPTWRSNSRSHLLAIRMTGKLSLSFTRRICWWNVLISSKEFREVME